MTTEKLVDGSVSEEDVARLAAELNQLKGDILQGVLKEPLLAAKLSRWLAKPSCFDSIAAYEAAQRIAEFRFKE